MRTRTKTPARLGLACALLLAALAGPAAAQAPKASGLDPILKELSTWNGGIESAAVWKLRDYVYARKDDAAGRTECEGRLAAFLKSPTATPIARITAARYLRVIGSDAVVPALQALLADDKTADTALFVLQQMQGAPAQKALQQALATAKGPVRVEIISVLGQRGAPEAVPFLAPLLKQPALAGPTVVALGAIGDSAAAQALSGLFATAPADLKPTVASAMMRCAERALAAQDAAAAGRLYDTLLADASLPVPMHKAAALGTISAAGAGATGVVMGYLKGSDAALQQVAVTRVKDVFPAAAIGHVATLLPAVPEATRIQLLAVLATYPTDKVLPAVMTAAKSDSPAVRLAALKALESVGDETTAPYLVEAASKAKGPEQAAARSALGLVKGAGVNAKLLAMLDARPSPEVESELLFAVGERRMYPAKHIVKAALASPAPRVRAQALRTLRTIGTPSDIPTVLDMVVKAKDDAEQAEAEATVGALAQKATGIETRSSFVRTQLMSEKEPAARARLIGVLPLTGDPSALPLLRRALGDENAEVREAAVKAFSAWPTSAAREDLMALARDSKDETTRLLAIQGLVRAITLERFRNPVAAVADLKTAAGLSTRPEEQRLVLGAVGQFPCPEAVELAKSFVGVAAVKDEAEAAVKRLTATPRMRERRQ
jgi:HEAT repeat protein